MAPRELYIVRHGIAEDENPDHPGSDHWRRLSDRGRARLEEAARGMLALGFVPEEIWTSPHLRASETAAVLDQTLAPRGGVTEVAEISVGGTVSGTISRVAESSAESICLVGHEPMLSDVVSELVAGGRLRIHLKKGSLVRILLHPLSRGFAGELASYMTPRALRAAGQ